MTASRQRTENLKRIARQNCDGAEDLCEPVMLPQRTKMLILAAVLVGSALVCGCLFFSAALLSFPVKKPQAILRVADVDSPLVVTVQRDWHWRPGDPWLATISADGRRSTQHAGWPVRLVPPTDEPESLTWHNAPDWVEIRLKSGRRLKLTWDPGAVPRAQQSSAENYFLNPVWSELKD